VFGSPSRDTPSSGALRLTADLGAGPAVLAPGVGASIALSTDGAQIAFLAYRPTESAPQLYVRRFEQSQAALLPETYGAESPFFSPDGKWIAFFSSGKLKKISVTGGAAIALCDAPNGRGGSWGEDGTIVFSPDRQTSLWRVPASGGVPEPLTTLDANELTQRWPQILPGGKAVLYSSLAPAGDFDFDKGNLVIQPLPTGARKVVQRGGYYGRYMPGGQLAYLHNGTLFAAAFDPVHLELTSPPVPVVESVISNTTGGAGMFAVSTSGALVYVPQGPAAIRDRPIEWMDRSGKTSSLRSAPADWRNIRFAPDGRTVAYDIFDGKQTDVWVNDWSRDRLTRLTTSTTFSTMPVWTPDGRRIAFASQRGEKAINTTFNLYWQRADGTGDVQRLTDSTHLQLPQSWHPSGKFLAFQEQQRSLLFRLMLLPIDGDETSGWRAGTPTVLLDSAFDQRGPAFSPDGRWIAYTSNQSGLFEVYVRPFPGPGGKWQISTGGGLFPTWSRTRRELLYNTFDQRIMVAPYAVDGNAFHAEQPRPWPEARFAFRGVEGRRFDLHPDGNRLALAVLRDSETIPKLDRFMIILNISDELRRKDTTAKR
jgi:serine/threonine-protein kinase